MRNFDKNSENSTSTPTDEKTREFLTGNAEFSDI